MIAQSLSNGYQATRETIKKIYEGFGLLSSADPKKKKSCALRVAFPTFLLLSNIAFRGQPSYIGTTLGTALLSGTVFLSDKIGDESDRTIFGLQAGTSLILLASSLSQLSAAGLPFYLSMATTVANGAMFAASVKSGFELKEKRDKAASALHALFPVVWGGLMLSSQSSYSWMPALSAIAQPIVLGVALLADYQLQDRYEKSGSTGPDSIVPSFGWLCLGASLVGTATSLLGNLQSSHWVNATNYGSALGLNLFTMGWVCYAAYLAKTHQAQ